MSNIIFCFTGTGNSLKAAKTISDTLGNTDIVLIGKPEKNTPIKHYDTVGFVYPVYFWGLPNSVKNFVETMDLTNNKDSYFYAVATFGGMPGNGISQLNELLIRTHNLKLHYGNTLKMVGNYIIAYDMNRDVRAITEKSDKDIIPIAQAITNRENNKVKKSNALFSKAYNHSVTKFASTDNDYRVSDDCTACGICAGVCPVKNIDITDGKPRFTHNCEQCLACIQYCPQKAINYKNATQNRGRYTNPAISSKEIADRRI
jgi:ferredoxin